MYTLLLKIYTSNAYDIPDYQIKMLWFLDCESTFFFKVFHKHVAFQLKRKYHLGLKIHGNFVCFYQYLLGNISEYHIVKDNTSY